MTELQSTATAVLAEIAAQFKGRQLTRFFASELLRLLDEKALEQGPEWGTTRQLRSFEGAQYITVLAEVTIGVPPEAFKLTVIWRQRAITRVAICYYHMGEGLLPD